VQQGPWLGGTPSHGALLRRLLLKQAPPCDFHSAGLPEVPLRVLFACASRPLLEGLTPLAALYLVSSSLADGTFRSGNHMVSRAAASAAALSVCWEAPYYAQW